MLRTQAVMAALHGADVYAEFAPVLETDVQGWNSDHPMLMQAVATLRPRIIVDVGVWKGRSTIFLADLLKRYGIDGVVIAVDTFLGSTEHWLNREHPDFFPSLKMRHGLPQLYWQFLSNIVRHGCADRVVPLAQTSTNAAVILGRLGLRPDLVHVDAAHELAPVLADARAYWSLLAPGGLLIGDDYSPVWPEVIAAAHRFAAEVGRPLQVVEPKWLLQKPEQAPG